jgi:phosphoglucomutase
MAQTDVLTGAALCDFDTALAEGRITLLDSEMDEDYITAVLEARVDKALIPAAAARGLSVAYSPFHGVGAAIFPEVMARAGLTDLHCVPEQMERDGRFPTLRSPNPEEPAGFALALELAKRQGCQLVLGTDPDADRLGVMVLDREGRYRTISANRMGALLTHYILTRSRELGTAPAQPLVVKTIVTTELTRRVAEALGAACADCFTGFKFIAERADRGAEAGQTCILGYEESIGYMVGSHARDKDGIAAGLLVTEMAAWYFLQGMTLADAEEQLLAQYGWYAEKTRNIMMPGLEGLRDMAALMAGLRHDPPAALQGYKVLAVRDYLTGKRTTALGTDRLELRESDVLAYELAGGQTVVIRPSGTEPKIKVYALMKGPDRQTAEEMAQNFADGAAAMLNIQ